MSRHFQVGGTWAYSKAESGFSLNSAIISDMMQQDANFIAGTYHDNGKLESRAMLGLPYRFGVGYELMFQGPDTRQSFYALEVSKQFDTCLGSMKAGRGMYSFSYMQTLMRNLFVGFECGYLVRLRVIHEGDRRTWATFRGATEEDTAATDTQSSRSTLP